MIDDENPHIVPPLVIATACDGRRGVFLSRDRGPLPRGPRRLALIAHNAAFDLKVLQPVVGDRLDLYGLVEGGRVWDTLVLRRLLTLATEGHTARASRRWRPASGTISGSISPSRSAMSGATTSGPASAGSWAGRPTRSPRPTWPTPRGTRWRPGTSSRS